jgi:CheY-like chemotaxis protein
VEDDPNDITLVHLAFRKVTIPVSISSVKDGDEAVNYLKGEHDYSDRTRHPMPTVVLLDIKIPRQSGLEVLAWIRSQTNFSALPVILFTSSQDLKDVRRAYQLGANAYLVKPVDFKELGETLQSFATFWLGRNFLPR